MAALAVSITSVNAIVLNFDALPNTAISFSGTGNFDFTSNSGGDQFQITTEQGTGAAIGLEGYIAGVNLFTIGQITDSGVVQTAPVTGAATLYIVDQNNIDLTGALQWNDISTFGTIGGVNSTGSVNLSDIQYSGTNADLLSLAAMGSASDTVSFQFTSPESLSNLVSTATSTSYSGSLSAVGMSPVPEPGSAVVLLAGLACFYGVLRCRKVKESRKVRAVKIETDYRCRPSK